MNANAKLFWILTGFFGVVDVAYVFWTLADSVQRAANAPSGVTVTPGIEWAGTVAIALCAVLSAFLAFYLGRAHSATGGELPEDRLDADIDDGDAEQGFFSPWSWWPIMLALGAAVLVLGLAVGVWLAFIGVAITGISLVGWVYEYYRGNFAR